MNIRKNKTIVCIITTLLIIAGSFLMGTPAGKVEASEATTISEKVLSVKCQLSEDKTKLRMVTTIDGQLQYKNVGFEVTFLGNGDDEPTKTKRNTVQYVYRRINSTDDAVKYEFGPKAFHASSEWIATYTITKIPESYLDNGIIIKPYVTMKDTLQKVYGEHRYLTMLDQENGVVSLPVKEELTNPTVADAMVKETYYDGTYTHVRVSADYATLPSISTYAVTDNGTEYTEKYRYLHSTVSSDQSWYNNSDANDKVIVTAGDMRGFQTLSKTNSFATDTIYLGADITFNEGKDLSVANASAEAWTPIGYSGMDETAQKFAGIFDGDMHSISGIYISQAKGRLGLFGETASGCRIQNLELKRSYIRSLNAYYSINRTGGIAGHLNGTLNTVKCDADVTVIGKGKCTGGLVGTVGNGVIQNSWFAGSVKYASTTDTNELNNQRDRGGLVGGLYDASSYCEIKSCLVTGNIDAGYKVGGFCGTLYSSSTVKITDSLFAGSFNSITNAKTSYIGTICGETVNCTAEATNVYVQNGSGVDTKIGNKGTNVDTGIATFENSELQGSAAYLVMDVDFYMQDVDEDATWFAIAESNPILTSFADKTNLVDLRTASGTRTFWYKPTDGADTYTLYSAADLRGFQQKAKTDSFAANGVKDTVKLGADINLSPNWTAGVDAPSTGSWTPIGYSGVDTTAQRFAGIFDGDMHSISGVHISQTVARLGLFGETAAGCQIQNLELKNSYIRSLTAYYSICRTGALVGNLNGSVHTVKCDTDVIVVGKGRCVGGIAGTVNNGNLENCWFAGKVQMARTDDLGQRKDLGGLIGGMYNESESIKCTIKNCLVTGELDQACSLGGLCGYLIKGSTLNVSNSLFAGNFVEAGGTNSNYRGVVLGDVASGTATLTNVYVQEGSGLWSLIGNKGTNVDTEITTLEESELKGNVPYGIMNVDFYMENVNEDAAWYAMSDSHPILTSFADKTKPVDLSTAQGTRTYWFDAENPKDSYTLYSPAELRGLQVLVAANNTFEGIEIKLGKDIDLNPGWKVSDGAAPNVWIPIGRSASDSNIYSFKGTFNGQGHTIKGVYVSSSYDRVGFFAATAQGSVVKNFTLENSAIYGTKTSSTGSVGSVIGRLGGTLDTVKSSADVILSGCEYAGGLVGDITTTGATITNCWFSGNMGGTGSHHAQLLGGVREGGTAYVTHCLATGTIENRGNTGGLVGTLWGSSTVDISDSLFAGKFIDVSASGTHGAVVGNSANGTVNVSEVYVQKGSGIADTKIIGNAGTGTHNDGQKANVKYVEIKELYLDDARENTALTIYPQGQDTSSDGNSKQYWWYVSETHPVLASFATPVSYDKVKVATYNIGSCIKLDTDNHESVRADVVSFIQDNNIDVCLLQEVDKECERSDNVDQAKAIADALGYHYAYIATLEDHYSLTYGQVTSYGIAIVSRYEITSTNYEYLDFSGQNEKRAILKAMVDVNGTETAVICTHFDNAKDTTVRTNAVATLKTMIEGLDVSTPVIFGGDLNQAYAGDETVVIKEVGEFLTSVTKSRYDAKTTYNVSEETGEIKWWRLDYIFTNSLLKCGRAKVYTPTSTTLEGELSDHRPLVVNLYMNIQK